MPSPEEKVQPVEFVSLDDGKTAQPLKTPVWLRKGMPACSVILIIILVLFPGGGYNFLINLIPSQTDETITTLANVNTPPQCTSDNQNGFIVCGNTKIKVAIVNFTAKISTNNGICNSTGSATDLGTSARETLSVFRCAATAIAIKYSLRFSALLESYYWNWGKTVTLGIGNKNSVTIDTQGKPVLESNFA